ncbi:MAG: DUF4446 family protein [Actinobacteria bacterium]|nr:DUF4446 family protein [Actinomycetota bacterium]
MNGATVEIIVALLGAGWAILAIWLIAVSVRLKRLGKERKVLAKAGENGDFVAAVSKSLSELAVLGAGLVEIKESLSKLEFDLRTTVRHVGVVRFDAFDDVGGKLSFAVALLNGHGDGVVLSTINGRQESRSYAKFIKNGDSSYSLSSEEREAIAEARSGDLVKA